MPKKASSWGQQDYVPAGNGDASGEYADDSGSNIHYTFDPENFGRGKGQVKEEPKKEEAKKEDTESAPSKNDGGQSFFNDYLKSGFKPANGVTAEGLETAYSAGTDDAKSVVNSLIKDGFTIKGTTNIDQFGEKLVELSQEATKEDSPMYSKGQIFYHEFSHAIDEWLSAGVSKEEISEAINLSRLGRYDAWDSQHMATATKRLSNGKTLFETLVSETRRKRLTEWDSIKEAYIADVDRAVEEKFGISYTEISKKKKEAIQAIKEEADKYFERNSSGWWVKVRELAEKDGDYKTYDNKLKEIALTKSEVGKDWSSISDICEGSGHESFHGGHGSSYWKSGTANGSKLHRGAEFLAEYCSALCRKDTNGKRELELFNKYFPETSKCAEELFAIAVNKSKGVKA